MAKGIQDTISTITAYSFWVFGIIIALNAVGISTTSLTVAFGALGIGLGFGLQNIFNNFISGLILLFERPIQVGDWVEINGTWGSVQKINVRSTIVQSVDNAALIIPNSEFISNRLINWSFKDPKIRRALDIGVAYGSDIKKVKEILLDIADKHPRVYRIPAPEVVFSDFGDSALLFQLRIWVHVDFSISTRTDIRFEIDRRFRENNITIPFPQRDVHIYNNG
ncbi:MAG: mechanosensitive ion channel [Candidatus Magnetomorum sp.]|nr:mechanosensitive ion channel [Candidatus Magnetomorum sp.]